MAVDKGLGPCLVPNEKGYPCGRQVAEGEPIGTVMNNGPKVGHKACAEAFKQRQQQEQNMVQRVNQQGPGGHVDMTQATDAIMGSIPLEKTPNAASAHAAEELPDLSQVSLPEGVIPASAVPLEDTPWGGGARLTDAQVDAIQPENPAKKGTPNEMTPQARREMAEFKAEVLRERAKADVDVLRMEINNRFTYHPPSNDQANAYGTIRERARELAHLLIDVAPDSRERALALTHLDETVMFANAAIARHG